MIYNIRIEIYESKLYNNRKYMKSIKNDMMMFIWFIVMFYIFISLFEWLSHYYVMHYNGFLKKLLDYLDIKMENSHIAHHKQTYLDQTLPSDNYIEKGLVFNMIDSEIISICILAIISMTLFWHYFPNFKKSFSLTFTLFMTFLLMNVYLWVWSSIHSHYHKVYVECNKKLKFSDNTVYSPVSFFVPNENSTVYKYLFWYHTLHHLTKGEGKGNYNIIFPLFDFIFFTYKDRVDNTAHFAKNKPSNPQEVWLNEHKQFEIRVLDNNIIVYKDINTSEWKTFPKNI